MTVRVRDFMPKGILDNITTTIASMLSDTQMSVAITYRITGTISFALTGSVTEVNATTVVLPALAGGYGAGARGSGWDERNVPKPTSPTQEEGLYFLVRQLAITDPEAIDRVTWDGKNYRVNAIRRDTLGTHYRIEVVQV